MRTVNDKAIVLETDNPHRVTSEIKNSAIVEGNEVAVKWALNEAQALVSLGFEEVPSPILRDYQWTGKLTPFEHQKVTASFLTLRKKAFCFSEQGCGKTASAIWAADYLMKVGKVRRVLVICPLSIMRAAWQQDLFKFAMHRSCDIAHGSAAARKKIIHSKAEFVVINFDGVAIVKDEIINGCFDLIIIDECTYVKEATTNRWKVVKELTKHIEWLWMLTGTPAAQSPLDAYGLAKLVNPENTPKFFGAFRDSVMYKVTQFKWAPKPHASDVVHRLLQPAIRFERGQCLDLPDVVHMDREAPLTPQQTKYYNLLKKEMVMTVAGEDISAVNAAVGVNKLLQVSGGCCYADNGEVIEFDVSNRLNTVVEAIEEASHKVLVFVPFTHTIDLLRDKLTKEGISCAVINGPVPASKRGEIVNDFQTTDKIRVLIIQPQAAAHGLTLTEADTIIWYAPVTSVETYLQANARINRPGQKHSMSIIHIYGSDVEKKLYAMLRGNIATHEKIIDLYRREVQAA